MTVGDWNPLRLLSPAVCLCCDTQSSQSLCQNCLDQLEPVAGKGCRSCHNPAVHRDTQSCSWCEQLQQLPETLCCLFAYRNTGKSIFHLIKFAGYWRLLDQLFAHQINHFFRNLDFLNYQYLVPIPESFSSKVKRHFNPADQIAQGLASRTGLPVRHLLKMRPLRQSQVGLSLEERRANVKAQFQARGTQFPESLILVDDVLTSGATLEAADKILRQMGVKNIAWFCLFRTP